MISLLNPFHPYKALSLRQSTYTFDKAKPNKISPETGGQYYTEGTTTKRFEPIRNFTSFSDNKKMLLMISFSITTKTTKTPYQYSQLINALSFHLEMLFWNGRGEVFLTCFSEKWDILSISESLIPAGKQWNPNISSQMPLSESPLPQNRLILPGNMNHISLFL